MCLNNGGTHTIADALAFLSGHKAVIWEERGAIVHFVDAISGLDLLVWVGECSRGFRKKQCLCLLWVCGRTTGVIGLGEEVGNCFEFRFGLSPRPHIRTSRLDDSRNVGRMVHADASAAYFGQIRAV